MALIDCFECSKQISSMALVCPYCGCPISASNLVANKPDRMPILPENLYVHTAVFGFGTPGGVNGYVSHACEIPGVRLGDRVSIKRLKEGLYIHDLYEKMAVVHFAQVVSAEYVDGMSVKSESKSVLGRAAVGAVLLGPFGAVVGGMSGLSKKQKAIDGMRLTFWSVDAKRYDTLLLETESYGLRNFCDLITKECAPYRVIHNHAKATSQ